MNLPDAEAFLQLTIAARKLSGGERSAFADWLAANVRTNQDRGVVRNAVFNTARTVSASLDTAQLLEWLEETLKVVAPVEAASPSSSSEAYFSPGMACLQQIIHRFSIARQTVDVCVFTITDDRITKAVLDAHRRGVALRILTDNDKAYDLGSDIARLQEVGIPVKIDQTPAHMHHKFAIFDRARLVNGSYNWTRSATDANAENVIDTGDPKLVAAFAAEFQRMWETL